MILLKKKVNSKLLLQLLLGGIGLLSFVQFGFHFWPDDSFVYGVRVDYLAPTLYLTDVLIAGLLCFVLLQKKFRKLLFNTNFVNVCILFLGFALINSSVAINVNVALFKWLKMFELLFVFRVLSTMSTNNLSKSVLTPFAFSSIFVVPLGLLQVAISGSTKLFTIFGERLFNIDTPGIASRSVFGHDTLRAYATFSHPNSFAGYLLLIFATATVLKNRGQITSKTFFALTTLAVVGVVTTMSFSSLAYLLLILAFEKIKKPKLIWPILVVSILFSLALPFVSLFNISTKLQQAATLRLLQYTSAFSVFKQFLWGVGLNNTILLQKGLSFAPFTFQPIHNVFLLIFIELGLVGFAGLLFLLFVVAKKAVVKQDTAVLFLAFFLPMLLDHYQFTLQQNLLTSTFALSFLWSKAKGSDML